MGNIKAGSKTIYKNQSEDKKHFFCRFVEYVFISTNSWFLGKLKTVKTTLIILPRSLIRQIEEQGRKLEVKLIKEKKYPISIIQVSITDPIDVAAGGIGDGSLEKWKRTARSLIHWRKTVAFLCFLPLIILGIVSSISFLYYIR